jgi:hypothetical protein
MQETVGMQQLMSFRRIPKNATELQNIPKEKQK